MKRSSIRIIKFISCLLCMIFSCNIMTGQDKEVAKKKMMEIKLNEDFIFGEGSGDDKELAYGDALDDLLSFANELKNMNSQEEIKLNDLITSVETIVYEEGTRYEVMVYIPFKIIIDTNRQTSSAKEEIKQTEKEPQPMETEKKDVEIPMPVKEEKVSLTSIEKITNGTSPTMIAEKGENPEPRSSNMKERLTEGNNNVEEFLVTQDNFTEIKPYLAEMKRTGKIKETGAVEGDATVPEDAGLIVMDEFGGILSILSPVKQGERINYKTNERDSEKNYNNKFIVWYRK